MKVFIKIGIYLIFLSYGKAYGFEFNCRSVYNATDVTEGLQTAFQSGADKIIIPYMGEGTKWISGPLTLDHIRNLELVFEAGVIVESKSGDFADYLVSFFTFNECHNIKIYGQGAEIKMLKHEYTDVGQWRHGISIQSSDSFEIEGLKISSTGGDGIYIGSNGGNVNFCSNMMIRNITTDQCARNGISVISCKNLLIENCEFSYTGKNNRKNNASNGPWAGIDLEPNFEFELLENITITNCIFTQNWGPGIVYAFGSRDNSVSITNNIIYAGWCGISLLGEQRGIDSRILFKNNFISGGHYGMYILNWVQNNEPTLFDECTFDLQKTSIPVKFEINELSGSSSVFGNISFNNTRFINMKDPCLIYLQGADSLKYFDNIFLTNTSKNLENSNNEFFVDNNNVNSSYSDKKVTGDNIFCFIENNSLRIKIQPNPVTDYFQFICNIRNPIDLQIYDPSGKLVLSKTVRSGEYVFCRQFLQGQYIIIARDMVNNKIASEKMIRM